MPSDEEMITLIKDAAQEGQFDKMSIEEMEIIYNQGSTLAKEMPHDEELIRAVNKFKVEIESRQLWKNNSNVISKREKIRQKIIQFINSKSYKIGFVLIYITMILIPSYHEFTAKIPPDNELKITNGELFIGPINKRGNMTGLKTPQGKILFTCGDTLTDNNACLLREDEISLEGKQVSVTWFRQNAYLGFKRNRLVELIYDGNKVISREKTERKMSIRNDGALSFAIIGLLIMLGVDRLYRKIYNKKI